MQSKEKVAMARCKTDIRPFIKQFYRGNRFCFLLIWVKILLEVVSALLIAWLLQQCLDLIGGYKINFTLSALVGLSLLLIAVLLLTYLIAYIVKPKLITRGISQYKEFLFEELTKKKISAFSGESSATYLSALTNDIQTIEEGYLWSRLNVWESLLVFFGTVAMMLYYSPLLTLSATGLSLLPLLASFLTGNLAAQKEKEVSDQNEIYTSTLKDCLGGFSVIKSFQAEAQMIRVFKSNVKALASAQCRRYKAMILVGMFASVAGTVAQLGVFLFGAYFVLSGKNITAGSTLLFVQLMNNILTPIAIIPDYLAKRKAAGMLVEKIALALNHNVREEPKSTKKRLEHGITIQKLSFGYESEKKVLENIDCSFELGKKYAIVGASGSGKSTLLNLLLASDQNYTGKILYDDTELTQIGSNDLYTMESVIQQNVFIFNATILENITMFRSFPEEEVREVIRLSGLSALVEEKGIDYLCGDNGSGLSGGEKQRISIARSLLQKAQVLLADEATASLDAETANQVAEALLRLQGVTCIIVTHALEEGILKQYDKIFTLKSGSIVESGTFDELIEKKGYFYSLFTISQ